jgi:two-component system, chemotaxis family, CheB/CheR fusion protein
MYLPAICTCPCPSPASFVIWSISLNPAIEKRPIGYGALHEKMVERYAPPSILINEHHEIVHYSAHAGRYLQLSGGEPTSSVFKLLSEPLRIELRAILHAAREKGTAARSRPIPVQLGSEKRQVIIRVQCHKSQS